MSDVTEQLLKEITKEYGEDLLVSAQEIIDRDPDIISISPALDVGLNGGIPTGSWMTVSGKAKAGKSSLCLSFAAKAQQAGMSVYYFDIEGRLKKKNLIGTAGLDYSPEKLRIIRSRGADEQRGIPAKILTAQDYLTIAEKILRTHPRSLLILDSVSMLCEAREADGGIGTETRGGGAKILSQFCRQMANVVPVQESIVVAILQFMSNTSGYGASIVEKGGLAIQYILDTKLRAKSDKPWVQGDKVIGQVVTWQIEESAIGPPGRTVESYLRYGKGIDDLYESLVMGEALGLVECAGNWRNLVYLGDNIPEKSRRANGGEKTYQLLVEHPEWAEELKRQISNALGITG